jgi:cobalt transporter subunit CbtA
MLRRLVLSGLIAGLIAGLVVSLLQGLEVTPLILEAETYEVAGGHDHGDASGAQEHDEASAFDTRRTAMTLLTNVLLGIGFGLMVAAGMGLFGGTRLWQGLLWGLAGFLAWNLAPALGLPPKLPGTVVAPLFERQAWWIGTALASSIGLGLIFFAKPTWVKPLGLVLLALPHVIGAPILPDGDDSVPLELKRDFVVVSLAVAAVFWLVLGAAAATVYRRLAPG